MRGRIAAAVAGVSITASSIVISQDEGSRRAAAFWMHAAPVYVNYRFVQFLNRDIGLISDDVAWPWYEELHQSYAPKVEELVWRCEVLFETGTTFSTQDDFIPKPYLKWMKKTQDNVPSEFKGDTAQDCGTEDEGETGLEFDDVFLIGTMSLWGGIDWSGA